MGSLEEELREVDAARKNAEGAAEDFTRSGATVKKFVDELYRALTTDPQQGRRGGEWGQDSTTLIAGIISRYDPETLRSARDLVDEVATTQGQFLEHAGGCQQALEGAARLQSELGTQLGERLEELKEYLGGDLRTLRETLDSSNTSLQGGLGEIGAALVQDRAAERTHYEEQIRGLKEEKSTLEEQLARMERTGEQERMMRSEERQHVRHPLLYVPEAGEGTILPQAMHFPALKEILLFSYDGKSLASHEGPLDAYLQKYLKPMFKEQPSPFLRGFGINLGMSEFTVLSGITDMPLEGDPEADRSNSFQLWGSKAGQRFNIHFVPREGATPALFYTGSRVEASGQEKVYKLDNPFVMFPDCADLLHPGKALDALYAMAWDSHNRKFPNPSAGKRSAEVKSVCFIASDEPKRGQYLLQFTSTKDIRAHEGNIDIGQAATILGEKR